MKTYKSQAEIEADIVDGVLTVKDDVTFEVSFSIKANIVVFGYIVAHNIDAHNIDAWNIDAHNIVAGNINAGDISFYAVAFSHDSFKCKSIVGKRENSKYFCLDKEVEITG